jgi:hypothetical protein
MPREGHQPGGATGRSDREGKPAQHCYAVPVGMKTSTHAAGGPPGAGECRQER